ncbi:MAG: hypothetical protein U1A78_38070 [Polyangia bacterium]
MRSAVRGRDGKPEGFLVHYNGTRWNLPLLSGQVTQSNLLAVSSSAADDVWAVGEGGTLLHNTDGKWAPRDSGTTLDLRAIGPSLGGEVSFAGQDGTILISLPPMK